MQTAAVRFGHIFHQHLIQPDQPYNLIYIIHSLNSLYLQKKTKEKNGTALL